MGLNKNTIELSLVFGYLMDDLSDRSGQIRVRTKTDDQINPSIELTMNERILMKRLFLLQVYATPQMTNRQ